MVAFDAITYNKGQALIRMLENYLGETAFRDGIRAYMAAHAYGNTTTADLWQALESVAHKPVTGIAASFTEQDGVPLITAETSCSGDDQRLTLRQDRFVIAPPRAGVAALPPRNWQVPVAVGSLGGKQSSDVVLLQGSTEIPARSCGEPIKVNARRYRLLPGRIRADHRAALAKSLPQMSAADRVNFLSDSWAMVAAGRAGPPSYLDAGRVGRRRRSPSGLGPGDAVFSALNRLARDRAERPAVQRYARAKLRPVFDRLGWEGSGSGDDDDTLLRASLISSLGELRRRGNHRRGEAALRGLPAGSEIAAIRAARCGDPCRRHHGGPTPPTARCWRWRARAP